jgi:hypothetical protein
MKLSDYLKSGTFLHSKGRLLKDISLNNGEIRKVGDIVAICMKLSAHMYHAEDNDWACHIADSEFEFVE